MSDPASVPGDAGASQAPPTPRTESNEPSELRPSSGAAPGDNGGEAAGEDRPRSNTRRRRGSRGGRGRGRQGQGQGGDQDGDAGEPGGAGAATGGSRSAGSRPDREGDT